MPNFNITLSAAAVSKLQALVQAYNANNGGNLTVAQWITLHLNELCISEELTAAAQALDRQKREELSEAVAGERERLLKNL